MRPKVLKVSASAAFAAGTAAMAATALIALVSQAPLTFGGMTVTPMAAGYDAAFTRMMKSPNRTTADLQTADKLSRAALALFPYDIQSWLRLAFTDSEGHGGRLSDAGRFALQRSYDLAPLDQHESSWRIWFALEHWEELPAKTQGAVRFEAISLSRNWMTRPIVSDAVTTVDNPIGRTIGYVWLQVRPNSPYS